MKKATILIFLISLTLTLFSQKTGSFVVNISKPSANDSVSVQTIKFVYQNDKIALIPAGELISVAFDRIIFDLKQNTMTILKIEDGKKKALLLKRPGIDEKWLDENNMEGNPDVRIESTTDIRQIQGKTAVKVEVKAKDLTSEIWVTNEVDFDFMEIIRILATDLSGSGRAPENLNVSTFGVGGFPLQITVKDKDGRIHLEMAVSEISDKAETNAFEMKGYKVEDGRK